MEQLPKNQKGLGIIPALSSAYNIISDIFTRRSEQKQYNKMLEYNSPKAQMQRYREAGLSPYLIYNQGNPGNAPTPEPANTIGRQEDNLGNYLAAANFQEDIKSKRINNAMLMSDLEARDHKNWSTSIDAVRKTLDLMTDYPNYRSHSVNGKLSFRDRNLEGSFRQQMNEMKKALANQTLLNLQETLKGTKSDNVVKHLKAKYAQDFGMTGGDWTSGVGLIHNMLKRGGRARSGQSARLKR